jgi:dephospho-CoA kinase
MLIGLTGRIAAGKESLTEFLRKNGFIYFETSEPLKDGLKKRGLAITRENMQNLGDELRKKQGAGVIMKFFLDKIEPDKNYIIDSIRNAGEVEFLRKNSKDFILIAIDAPQKIRFDRIIKRGKPSDPKTWEDFLKADNRDFFDETNPLGQQVGKCMELADYKIMNDGEFQSSLEKVKKVWEEIKEKC